MLYDASDRGEGF